MFKEIRTGFYRTLGGMWTFAIFLFCVFACHQLFAQQAPPAPNAAASISQPVTFAQPITANPSLAYPSGAVPIAASTLGTTSATTATLPAVAGKTTYLCGFNVSAVATAANGTTLDVTGTIGGGLFFNQNIGASPASAITSQTFQPCVPASAPNTSIAIIGGPAGIGGVQSVNGWGFQL
jgi:hypothetical protein